MSSNGRFVSDSHPARQWDARFNVPTEDALNDILTGVKREAANGKFQYVLVGGPEIGELSWADDYQIRHIHLALVYNNRVTKSSILKNLNVKRGLGYYLVPRNQQLPVSGWIEHHKKVETKVDPEVVELFSHGEPPKDTNTIAQTVVKRSEQEKKRKIDDIILEMSGLIDQGKEEECHTKFPRAALDYVEKIKARKLQTRDFFKSDGHPHIWLWGDTEQGKTALMQLVYPKNYNKTLENRFFDKYSPEYHTHVLLQDVDHDAFEKKLGIQFFKAICDEAGYPIDAKYKTPQIVRLTVLVTSNFNIDQVVPEDMKGRRQSLPAIRRRFFEVNVRDMLILLGLKLIPKYERLQLKKSGNTDTRQVFYSWDYARQCPTGEPLKTAEEYQQMIKNRYYG